MGLQAHKRPLEDHERVRGIGGNMKLTSCWIFPFGLYGVDGQNTSYELDQKPSAKEVPMLISNTVQRQLLISIELGDRKQSSPDRVCFRAWGDEVYDLEQAPNGNPSSSLLQFAAEGHPGIDAKTLSECYSVVLEPTFDTWDGGDGVAVEVDESMFQAEAAEIERKEDDVQFSNMLQGIDNDASLSPAQRADLPGGRFDVACQCARPELSNTRPASEEAYSWQ